MNDPIIIIGGGAMGGALASRWRTAVVSAAGIHVVEPDEAQRAKIKAYGVHVHAGLADFNISRGIVVLAVKPQVFPAIVEDIKRTFTRPGITFVSIMAGVSLEELQKLSPRVVRVMPNTPSLVGAGMAVACNPKLERSARNTITKLFEAVGRVMWVEDESLMHAVTAISGSGPAYVFAFMEALERAGVMIGLSEELSHALVLQTVLGAAQLANHSDDAFAGLRKEVTSPAGTTEAALKVMLKDHQFIKLIAEGVKSAYLRSKELTEKP